MIGASVSSEVKARHGLNHQDTKGTKNVNGGDVNFCSPESEIG